ncbi:hypothetical protein [Frigoriglobus tundricola]|uniref:Uncharacterized protein n=1 Tax=Frigoriglobus tundricola TaxID=2774151 RepID=A0A6M5YQY6_9BACT|nr:hypothetical protein [Frigoriglobus tundricola]QJW95661.1 hypothetical protein FTUN_3215 [Frigoriglobus tundricola]
MAIEFVCPACGGTLRVGDETAGRVIRCGGCMTALRVPAADADTGPAVPPNPYDNGRQYPPSDPAPARGRPVPAAANTASLPDAPPARPVAPPRRAPRPGRRPRAGTPVPPPPAPAPRW